VATIEAMAARLGRPLPLHILPTLHRPDAKLASDLHAAIQRRHGATTLPLSIREHEVLREAAGFGQPITEYAPGSPACEDFVRLVDWLMEHPTACTRASAGNTIALPVPSLATEPPEAPSPRVADLLARMRAHAGFSAEIDASAPPQDTPSEPAKAEGHA
jgi:chromosome partitioning protein